MLRWIVLALGLGALAAPAAAQTPKRAALATAAEYQTRAAEAIDGDRLSEALQLIRQGLARFPGDAGLHHRYGVVLARILDIDAAREHLEIARKASPNNPEVLVELGWVHLANGNAEAALELARRAAELDPESVRAVELLVNLQVHQRIRAGRPAPLTHGASKAVLQIIGAIRKGDLAKVFERDLEPTTIDRIRSAAGVDPRMSRAKVRQNVAAALERGWEKVFDNPGNRYAGFDVQPGPALHGPEHHVSVNVLMRRSLEPERIAQIKRFVADRRFAKYVDPEIVKVARGLNAADRARYFQRLGSQKTWLFVGTVWIMVKVGDAWRVRDVKLGDRSFIELIAGYKDAADAGLVKLPAEKKSRYRVLAAVARLVGVAAILLIIIVLLRRRARQL